MAETTTPRKRSRYARYTLDERLQALEVLKQNDYDYERTERETGVNRSTLSSWNQTYRKKIESDRHIQLVAEAAQADFRAYKLRFLQGHFADLNRVAKKAIGRAETLLESADSLRDVAKVLEVLYNYVEKLTDENTPQPTATLNNARIQINNLNAAAQ